MDYSLKLLEFSVSRSARSARESAVTRIAYVVIRKGMKRD